LLLCGNTEATINGGSGKGVIAAAVNADDGMVVAASTAAAQLTMTTAIAITLAGVCIFLHTPAEFCWHGSFAGVFQN
jgi:hypothetical protein